MESNESSTPEYAQVLLYGEGIYSKTLPCHLGFAFVQFNKTNGNVKNVEEFRTFLRQKMSLPFMMICIKESEEQQFQLAKNLMNMPEIVAKFSGRNPLYSDRHIFHDIIYATGK